MNFESRSSQDLVLQRCPSIGEDACSVLNSTFTLQDYVEITQHNNGEFYDLVKEEMREKGIERDQAMDSVRLQKLIEQCDTKENTALYLLQEWNYEPQVCRFLKLLCDNGVNLENVEDFLHNNPLHIAATKNYVKLALFLIKSYPSMLLTTNAQGELPVETAIRNGQDDVAAVLIRRMDHRRVSRLFKANQQRTARISIMKMTDEFKMQKTIVAILDCLISPRWPHPPCLPSDNVPCLSWENFQDTPTHFHVTYDILESDINGRCPDDPEYEYTPKSCYYNLAKYCQRTLNKDILNHVVIRMLTARKWKKYGFFWFRLRAFNYFVFLSALVTTFMMAANSPDPMYCGSSRVRCFLDLWCITVTIWFLLDEISELKREPRAYILDVFNYFDLSGYSIILGTFVLRFFESDLQWPAASLATFINFIGVFKYSIGSRDTGMYIKCLGKVVQKDIPRFLSVFTIILWTFSISFYLAMRAYQHEINHEINESSLENTTLGRREISCIGSLWCVMLAGVMTWLEGSSIVKNVSDVGLLGAILIVIFMISVSIILVNILIAQLSLTYQLVQEESLLSFTALRMQAVATIEWQSRFKYWNLRKKYYVPGELKTRKEVEDLMSEYKECPGNVSGKCDRVHNKSNEEDTATGYQYYENKL